MFYRVGVSVHQKRTLYFIYFQFTADLDKTQIKKPRVYSRTKKKQESIKSLLSFFYADQIHSNTYVILLAIKVLYFWTLRCALAALQAESALHTLVFTQLVLEVSELRFAPTRSLGVVISPSIRIRRSKSESAVCLRNSVRTQCLLSALELRARAHLPHSL